MRVAFNHLVADALCNIGKGKAAIFLGHARMKHHLQQQIPQLVTDVIHIPVRNGVGNLIGLFDRVGCDTLKGLLDIPRAPLLRVTKLAHDGNQPCQFIQRGLVNGVMG